MKKLLSVLLVAVLLLGMSPAFAEEVVVNLFGLKIEIDPQLKEYAAWYSEQNPGVKVVTEAIGGGGDYGAVLKTKNQAGDMPQIIQVEGLSGYNDWKDYVITLNDSKWTERTTLAFKDAEGNVVGFPVAIEGYGLVYNKGILEKAGIDPESLNTRAKIEEAFAKIDGMKEELGLKAVLAGATSVSGGMWWSFGQHVFNTYFTAGLEYGDRTHIDMAITEGKVDEERLKAFASYMAMLMKYSEPTVLSQGDYNAQVTMFANQEAAFITQGNWIDPNLKQLNVDFEMGFGPHAFLDTEDNGMQLNPPSWYLVTNTGTEEQQKAAVAFLESLVETPEGQAYMVEKAGMVPAFSGIEIKPEGRLSLDLIAKNERGGNHNWFFGEFPSGYGRNVIGPILDFYAQNPENVDVDALFNSLKEAIAQMPALLAK